MREKYGQAARRVTEGRGTRCGIDPPPNKADPITSNLYDERETAELPREAVSASLGCGNPTALAALRSGTL